MLDRRKFLTAIAVAPAATAGFVATARAEDDLHRAPAASPGDRAPEPQAELPEATGISRDLSLAGGFVVAAAYGVHHGALPFVLEGEGERFQLDVLRRDPAGPRGVYDTDHFSVFVADHGAAHTMPARERGARALGAALERRVAAGTVAPVLASFLERRMRHPSEAYDVLARAGVGTARRTD